MPSLNEIVKEAQDFELASPSTFSRQMKQFGLRRDLHLRIVMKVASALRDQVSAVSWRRPGDEEIVSAIRDARVAVSRLEDLMLEKWREATR